MRRICRAEAHAIESQVVRYAICALLLVFLATSGAESIHAGEGHDDGQCSLCAAARLPGEVPTTAPVLAASNTSAGTVTILAVSVLPVKASPVTSSRAPPSSADQSRFPR